MRYKYIGKTVIALIFAFFFIYVVGGLWIFPFNYLLPQHFNNFVATSTTGRVIERLGFLFCFIAAAGYIKYVDPSLKPPSQAYELNSLKKAKLFFLGALITLFLMGLGYVIAYLLDVIQFTPASHIAITDKLYTSLYDIFLIGITGHFLVALGEEMVYRGLVFRYLLTRTNLNYALILSSLIFSFFHFHYSEPLSFLVAFLGGYLLALLYYQTKSLLICISVHWAYNLFMHVFTPPAKSYLLNYFDVHIQEIAGWGTYFSILRALLFLAAIIFFSKRELILNERTPGILTYK